MQRSFTVLGLRATKGVFGARMAELRQARG